VIDFLTTRKSLLLLGVALAATPAVHAQKAIGEVFSNDVSVRGRVAISGSGTRVFSGSQVTAGDVAALLKLERGGQLRICPKTNLSLSADASGKVLALGLNTGALEINYELGSAADSLLTPDFRLQLISPGTFHLAISVSPSGDTCLRSLAGGDAPVFATEMMGNGSYQLLPGKSVLFRAGKISGATAAPSECGCPEIAAEMDASRNGPAAAVPRPAAQIAAAKNAAMNATTQTTKAHLGVDSSFVYRGNEAVRDYCETVSRLSISTDNSKLSLALLPAVIPPVAESTPAAKKEGILRRLGSLLQRLFHR
jgi:hypothetical protein